MVVRAHNRSTIPAQGRSGRRGGAGGGPWAGNAGDEFLAIGVILGVQPGCFFFAIPVGEGGGEQAGGELHTFRSPPQFNGGQQIIAHQIRVDCEGLIARG